MLKRALSILHNTFSVAVLTEAKRLVRTHAVLTVRLSEGLLKSRVLANQHHIYDVYLDFKKWPAQPAQCGCSLKQGLCVHVAASLLCLQEKNKIEVQLPQEESAIASEDWVEYDRVQEDRIEWYSHYFSEGDEFGFFSYELGIVLDGEKINLIPFFISLVTHYEPATLLRWPPEHRVSISLDEQRVLELPFKRIQPFVQYLLSLHLNQLSKANKLKLSRYELLLMTTVEQSLDQLTKRWYGLDQLKEGFAQLMHFNENVVAEQCAVPTHFNASLRPYQKIGFLWLNKLRMAGFGGILADDMGLGKTLQALALLAQEKEQGRLVRASLIVAPTSVVGNWVEECRRVTPTLRVLLYHGQTRYEESFESFDIVLSTYGMIQRDKRRFLSYGFYYLILDEAQYIKNTRTKTTQVIQQIQSEYRLCLTGTPLENHLGELWSLFHFLVPGLLGDRKSFDKTYRIPIEKHQDNEQLKILLKRIQPFILRRTKNDVLKDLPEKIEMIQWVSLSEPQRDLYESIRVTTERSVREAISVHGFLKSQIILLDALLKLRQVCCDPRLLSFGGNRVENIPSEKLNVCMELLDNLVLENRRVLIFSQFTSMLALIEEELIKRQYDYLKLTGKTKNRQSMIERFQTSHIPVFLISLKAGGTGLNLTAADTVIHFDPWWNPAVENQATDRSHRIGQTRTVFVYRLITKGTVEEVMMSLQSRKRDLFSALMNAEVLTQAFHLEETDLEALFGPYVAK